MEKYVPSYFNSAELLPRRSCCLGDFIENPLELVVFFDDDIQSGREVPYEWQMEVLKDFNEEYRGVQNVIDLRAANGSGKSKNIIAPCAVYSALFQDAVTVVTSSSGSQLDAQTGKYIKNLCRAINSWSNEQGLGDVFLIQKRSIKGIFKYKDEKGEERTLDSEVVFFATDEPGRAEGWHKITSTSYLTIIVDEAKTVHDKIIETLDTRCHDAQRYLKVSSTGGTVGAFYRSCVGGQTKHYKIVADDCPHISEEQKRKLIASYGENSPIVRSALYSDFINVDGESIINLDNLQDIIKNPPKFYDDKVKRVGFDLAAGGDENVGVMFQGNRMVNLVAFKERDTTHTIKRIDAILTSWAILKTSEYIFMDDGGIGKAIIDGLVNLGWNIHRIHNQGKSVGTHNIFRNKGAEMYYNFASFVSNKEIILLPDDSLLRQLPSRSATTSEGRIKLVDKKIHKAANSESPDRADACVLALCGLRAPYWTELGLDAVELTPEQQREGLIQRSKEKVLTPEPPFWDAFKYRGFDTGLRPKYEGFVPNNNIPIPGKDNNQKHNSNPMEYILNN